LKKSQITLLILLVVAAAMTVGCGSSSVPTFKQMSFLSNRSVTPATPLFVMNLDGSGVTPVALTSDGAYSPSNSANLKSIVFASSGNVWISDASGTNQKQLTTYDDNTQWAFEARISPNGKTIAYAMYDSNASLYTLWVINPDGTGAVNLTATLPTGMTGCYNGSFSADSSKIVYSCYGPSSYGLYLVKADGTGSVTTVTTQTFFMDTPAFSPDGKQIFFVQFSGPSAQRVPRLKRARFSRSNAAPVISTSGIASIDLDGSNLNVLVSANSLYEVEVLNSTLYYTAYDSTVDTYQIYKANLDGTGSVKVSDGTAEDYLGLSAD
jgi:Tol biopolymer transport system component